MWCTSSNSLLINLTMTMAILAKALLKWSSWSLRTHFDETSTSKNSHVKGKKVFLDSSVPKHTAKAQIPQEPLRLFAHLRTLTAFPIISRQFVSTILNLSPSIGICFKMSSELKIGSRYNHVACTWTANWKGSTMQGKIMTLPRQ